MFQFIFSCFIFKIRGFSDRKINIHKKYQTKDALSHRYKYKLFL
nr:MAG TPA: hypothetical protein [Caudoviricetes sp.]